MLFQQKKQTRQGRGNLVLAKTKLSLTIITCCVIIIFMTPEEKELLKRSVALSEENNNILRSMRRSMRLSKFFSIIYYMVIIGSVVGAYYLVQPYINAITDAYGGATSNIGSILENFKNLSQ